MPDKPLKILGVHGLGDQRASDWTTRWPTAIKAAFPQIEGLSLEFRFVTYDDIFADTEITLAESVAALWKLTKSGLSSLGHRERGVLTNISEMIKWTAGYVVAWVEDEGFKKKSRRRILDAVQEHQPDGILAHSLGSLVTFNAFTHQDAAQGELPALLSKLKYITFGSQIGNPFVIRNLTNGRIEPLKVSFWHHLYNVHDDVFTAEISMPGTANFRQTDTPFDDEGVADHAAESYFQHRSTIANVWPIGAEAIGARPFGRARTAVARSKATPKARRPKALLIGINDYPEPSQRLEGCINDVFLMSSVLQECDFPPETIRTCLDSRATAEGIISRLKWLVEDAKPNDELFFYYSGHGARIPEYGNDFEPDHHIETLVAWDFDWSRDKCVSDSQIFDLYSQLPYETRLVMVLDCCHAGGIHRNGGMRARGVAPPDDIRHRELKWDRKTKMWVARNFARPHKDFTDREDVANKYFGHNGATERIGRASMLRSLSQKQYKKLKKSGKAAPFGPYLPVIVEACQEDEYSYEYRHGSTSYGAFTYSLASVLRSEKTIAFKNLVDKVRDQLADLRYEQVPQILGPSSILEYKVPWTAG